MRSEPTRSLQAARTVLCTLLAALLLACAAPSVNAPENSSTPTPESSQPTPSPLPTLTPPPPQAAIVERVTFATLVHEDGAPWVEASTIPEKVEMFYLCIRARDVRQGTRFQATWYEGDQVIGESEKRALQSSDRAVWFSMPYRPITPLNTGQSHRVDIRVNGVLLDQVMVRIGDGRAADAIAAIGFADGFDLGGNVIDPKTRFSADAGPLTLRVRVSNEVDPTRMTFTTRWYRDEDEVARIIPDFVDTPAMPNATPGNATPHVPAINRVFAFTWAPNVPRVPGDYRVDLLMNGVVIRSVQFRITPAS